MSWLKRSLERLNGTNQLSGREAPQLLTGRDDDTGGVVTPPRTSRSERADWSWRLLTSTCRTRGATPPARLVRNETARVPGPVPLMASDMPDPAW